MTWDKDYNWEVNGQTSVLKMATPRASVFRYPL